MDEKRSTRINETVEIAAKQRYLSRSKYLVPSSKPHCAAVSRIGQGGPSTSMRMSSAPAVLPPSS